MQPWKNFKHAQYKYMNNQPITVVKNIELSKLHNMLCVSEELMR